MNARTPTQSNPRKGFFLALGSAVLFSTNYVTAKYALRGFAPWTFTTIWCSAAALYAFIILITTGRIKQILLPRRSFAPMLLLGLANAGSMILGWTGLSLIDPSFAAFLWRFAPVMTIVAATIFLSEKLSSRLIAPAVLMIAGGLISTLARWEFVALGASLILLACAGSAVQMIIAKKKASQIQSTVMVFYRVSIAAVAVGIFMLVVGKANFNVEAKYWLVVMVGAFLGPCAGVLLMFKSFSCWDLSSTSIVITAEPLLVLPFAFVAFNKLPAEMELIGGLIILAGAFWLAKVNTRQGPYYVDA